MKPVEFDNMNSRKTSEDALIHVIGPNLLQNELLSSFLESNLAMKCRIHNDPETSAKSQLKPDSPNLFLIDCLGMKTVDPWVLYDFSEIDRTSQLFIALYNVHPDADLEEKAMEHGIHGLIYQQESFKVLCKVIPAILAGELWYSRKMMSRCLLNGQGAGGRIRTDIASCLTGREREILIRIATGTGNQQIADELYISLNTVKTHIYNIYKKINVKNRLQASLWAARYV